MKETHGAMGDEELWMIVMLLVPMIIHVRTRDTSDYALILNVYLSVCNLFMTYNMGHGDWQECSNL